MVTKGQSSLKSIHDYLKYEKKTPQGAANVKKDILQATREVIFKNQYQRDEIEPEYRRIIVRHYKLLYKEKAGKILILRIFDTYQNPKKQLEE